MPFLILAFAVGDLVADVFSEEKIVKEKTKTAPKIKKSEENEDEK